MARTAVFLVSLALVLLTGTSTCVSAEFTLHALFTDHAVLQQGLPVPVWGTASAGDVIEVCFSGQTQTVTTSVDGQWVIVLEPLSSSADPRDLVVSSGDETRTVTDVLVGEVWVCSGQSNMARNMAGMHDKKDIIDEAKAGGFPNIRLFHVPVRGVAKPQANVEANWETCTEISVHRFSATGFYFGRALNRDRKVPVGLIQAAYGGTNATCWISPDTLQQAPALAGELNYFKHCVAEYPLAKRKYETAFKRWNQRMEMAEVAGETFDDERPWEPMGPDHMKQPGGFYNGMVAPLQPYPIAGVIWYQGESNATTPEKAIQYKALMLALIEGWRTDWASKAVDAEPQRDFPFYLVQLPNFGGGHPKGWPIIRDQMLQVAKEAKNAGMVVTIDIGDPDDIHPQNKRVVGGRLSQLVRGDAYGEDLVYSGPIYRSMTVQGDAVIIEFDHVGSGLTSSDSDPLRGFSIASGEGQYIPATATILAKDRISVTALKIKKPKRVRYAWHPNPDRPNLANHEGLPASPFHTDDWQP